MLDFKQTFFMSYRMPFTLFLLYSNTEGVCFTFTSSYHQKAQNLSSFSKVVVTSTNLERFSICADLTNLRDYMSVIGVIFEIGLFCLVARTSWRDFPCFLFWLCVVSRKILFFA